MSLFTTTGYWRSEREMRAYYGRQYDDVVKEGRGVVGKPPTDLKPGLRLQVNQLGQYIIVEEERKAGRETVESRVARQQPPADAPQAFRTHGMVVFDAPKIDDHETTRRLNAAGYRFNRKPYDGHHPRAECYTYELFVVFDAYRLGVYTPA